MAKRKNIMPEIEPGDSQARRWAVYDSAMRTRAELVGPEQRDTQVERAKREKANSRRSR